MKALLAEDHEAIDYHDEWYWVVGSGVLAVMIGAGVAAQRDGFALPPTSSLLWAALGAAPFVFDAIFFPTKRLSVPIAPFVLMVVGAVIALEMNPVETDVGPFFLVLLSSEMASRLRVSGAIVVLAASWSALFTIEVWGSYDESFIWFLAVALGWAGGFAVQSQFRLVSQMKRSQETMAARAVAEERARIAREIHDVVAHTLSVTMLHLTGARLALERGDRNEATTALLEAERAGRESLADIRATVNILAGKETGTDAPMPGAGELVELVAGFRSAGLDVDLSVRGDVAVVPAATGLAVYRIAQESLANVVKHAPGATASVCLDVDERNGVRLEVADSGNGSAGATTTDEGRGLQGMKERVELLGGTVHAGRAERGWVVEATLPGPPAPKQWCP